jgi:preprotein translocase subunit SecF
MINIVKYRYYFFGLSLLVIIPGLLALLIWGLPLAIDFTGGSLLDIRFESGTRPEPAAILAVYTQNGFPDSQAQTSGDAGSIIRSKAMDEVAMGKIVADLEKLSEGKIVVQRFDSVGPAVGREVASRAALAVAGAAIGIMLYITFAFRGVTHAFRYGIAAIIAMLHDVLVVIGVGAILGHFVGWEIDALFLTALLTVIGFSVHDTIVVFDRIRENSSTYRRLPYETIVNHSIVQTLDRSINTSLMVAIVLLSMALLGGLTIRHFVVILLIGVISGTYSSIFNAAPILVVWENREWRTWFKPRAKREAIA